MTTNIISVKVINEGFRAFKVGRMIQVTRGCYEENKKYLKPTIVAKSTAHVSEPDNAKTEDGNIQ